MMRDKDLYRFYKTTQEGVYSEVEGLTKRQAVIRFNKAQREIGYELKECGWEVME
jgi:hypothetical protein